MRFLVILALIVTGCISASCKSSKSNDSASSNEGETGSTSSANTDTAVTAIASNATLQLSSAQLAANGSSAYTVNVTVTDSDGNPVSGYSPLLAASEPGVQISQTCNATDQNGVSTCPNAVSAVVARTFAISLAELTVTPVTASFAKNKYGHTSRYCGFDMNRNGTFGEADDCRVCDGSTTNVDGKDSDEDLIYVDSYNGNDSTGNGSPSSPYQTIQQALNAANGTGQEDIICLYGTFKESMTVVRPGITGTYVYDGIPLPDNPAMIVGWDKDGDGIYPPVDPDDEAVLDGQTGPSTYHEWAFDMHTNNVNHFELAHLTIKNYRFQTTSGGVFDFLGTAFGNGIFIHDVVFDSINKGEDSLHTKALMRGDQQSSVTFLNNQFVDIGARVFSDTSGASVASDLYFKENSFSLFGPDGSFIDSSIMVLAQSNLTFSNNYYDANLDAWNGGFARSINIQPCSFAVFVNDNYFAEVSSALSIRFNLTCGTPAPTTDINFFNNHVFITNTMFGGDAVGISSQFEATGSSTDENYHAQFVRVYSNFIVGTSVNATECLNIGAGQQLGSGELPGTISFVGNTCVGTVQGVQQYLLSNTRLQDDIVVFGNIFQGASYSTHNIRINSAPSNFFADYNLFTDDSLTFHYSGSSVNDLASWQALGITPDANSEANCTPSYVNAAIGDYHLSTDDTCASGAMNGIQTYITEDIDGEARPNTNADRGADQK